MNTKEILQGIKDWAAPKVIYDISAAHNNTKYTDLSDALGTNGGNIPQEYRKGGMSVKFVQSSDNKYVQARCMAQNFTTDVTQWQGVDDVPTAGSNNMVKSGGVVEYADKNIFNKIGLEILPSQFLYGYVALWGGPNAGKVDPVSGYNCIIVPVIGIIRWKNYNPDMVSGVAVNAILYSGFPSTDTYIQNSEWGNVIGHQLASNVKYVAFNFNDTYSQSDYEAAGFEIYIDSIFASKTETNLLSEGLTSIVEKYENEIENDCIPVQILKGKAIQKLGYLINFSQTNLYVYDVRSIRNTNNLYKVSYDDWNILTYVAVKSLSDIPTDSAHASTASFIKFEQSGGNDHSVHSIFRNVPTGANYIVVSLKTTETPLNVFRKKINVDCYGDSLTDAGAWVGRLQELLGNKFNVRNFGISGQGAASITYRQGGTPIYIGTAFTIPASRDYVEVNVVNYPGGTAISNLDYSNQHANINPVYINRVKGELKYESSKWYFRRELAGAQISVPSGKVIYTHGLQDIGDISIFWMGTNDAINSYGSWVRGLISSCTEKVFSGKFLVLGLHAPRTNGSLNVTIQDIQDFNAELKITFGNKFVDELDYMCHYGMAGLGLPPTATDEQYMADGKVPPSLLDSAEIHYTAEASSFLGEYIYAALVENGYLGNIK